MSVLQSSLKVATILKSIEDSTVMERVLSRFENAWIMNDIDCEINLEIEYLDQSDLLFCLSLPGFIQVFVNDDMKICIQLTEDLG